MNETKAPDLSLLLELMKNLQEQQRETRSDLREIMHRITALDLGQAGIRRDLAQLAETDGRIQASLDRMADRVERIERRLDLNDAPAPHS